MMPKRRIYWAWGLIPLGVASVLMLYTLDAIPQGLFDLLMRAWPILLILIGLLLLLRGRIPLGGIAAFGLSAVLVAGVAGVAYSTRASQERTENEVYINQAIDEDATLLVVNVVLNNTNFTLRRATESRVISGVFIGSEESDIQTTFNDEGGLTVEYTIHEEQSSQFPLLTAVGRGSMTLDVPADIAVAINIVVADGLTTLNLSDLQLERLTLTVDNGNAAITLPNYQPVSLNPAERPGEIIVSRGNLTLLTPNEIDVRVAFDRRGSGTPVQYDALYIDQRDDVDGTLRRELESSDVRLFFDVTIPRGQLRLDVIRE
jgi:hypothetical protein